MTSFISDKNNNRPLIGVGVLIWREKQILLGERCVSDQAICWQFPGGHLENDESVLACAQREVVEETGLQIKNLRHLGFTDKLFSAGGRKYITLLVSCDYSSGEAQVFEPDKCLGWKWFDYKVLPSPLFEPINIFLSQQVGSETSDLYSLHRASQGLSITAVDQHQ
ncbi:MAG: NUDIX domain-containing protein [Gammaproteobacteria bacterium]|nr:NUDIX domain-containing protein [Gammaproteobacteria bacterium]